jgi:LemA protein
VKAALIAIPALAVLALGAGGEFFAVRGKLAAERDAVNNAWTGAEAALERRADLVPELAELMKGFAPHESAIFAKTADAGAALAHGRTPREKIAANDRLSGALSSLLVLSENYPALGSDPNFTRLERELATAENNIAIERRKYNELLERYNTSLQIFPDNLVAHLAGFAYNGAYLNTGPGPITGSRF